jgi:hypothetical protein
MSDDKVDQAIAAAALVPDFSQNVEVPILISSSGRPAVLSIPIDVTDAELLELVGWLTLPAGGLRSRLAATRGPQLVVARGRVPS